MTPIVASPTACRLLTGSRSTSTASALPNTMPLSRMGAITPNKQERRRAAGRDCPHHAARSPTANLPSRKPKPGQHHERHTFNARTPLDSIGPIFGPDDHLRQFRSLRARKLAAWLA
jgi:hypothetical protein